MNWLFVPQASQSSPYRRAKSDIWLAIPPALKMPAEREIIMINYRKLTAALIAGTITCFSVAGCSMPWDSAKPDTKTETVTSAQSGSSSEAVNTSSVTYSESDSDISIELDEDDINTSWNESECTKIELTQTSANINGSGAAVENNKVTITEAGTYVLSGTLTDGCIDVNVSGKGTVRLILNGVNITSSTTAPFIVEDAKKVVVTLADGTTNTFTDSTRVAADDEDYSAAVYSKADLTFNGNGTLNINAGYRNGIKSTDDLKIVSGTYNITSNEDGIVGKDLLAVKTGIFNITSGQDGMKSTYDKDDTKGNIIIDDGTFNITASTDGIQSEHILRINGGEFNIKTGNGYQASTKSSNSQPGNMGGNTTTTTQTQDEDSMKGLKAGAIIKVTGGTYIIDSQDDAVHTNGNMYIDNGKYTINTGNDAFHADTQLVINGGTIDIQNSYEGIESLEIIINGGDINVTASDDGINASGGSSDSTDTQQQGMSDNNRPGNMDNNDSNMNLGQPGVMMDGNQSDNGTMGGNGNNMGQPQGAPDGNQSGNGMMGGNSDNMGQPQGSPDGNQSDNGTVGGNGNNMGQLQGAPDENQSGNGMMGGNSDNMGQLQGMPDNNKSGNMGGFGNSDSNATMTINGGNLFVNASGDGLDANGSIYINGGTVIICGPTSDGDTAIDFDSACEIKGGTVMAFGSSGMLETPTSAENGACIVTSFSSVSAGTQYTLTDSTGKTILSYTPSKAYASAIVYSADISTGNTYTVNAGSVSQSVTVNSAVTSNASSGAAGGKGNRGMKTR